VSEPSPAELQAQLEDANNRLAFLYSCMTHTDGFWRFNVPRIPFSEAETPADAVALMLDQQQKLNDWTGQIFKQMIEDALGSTLFTANNPTGIAVELVDGGFRIYDDWVSDTFTTLDESLAHARKYAQEGQDSAT